VEALNWLVIIIGVGFVIKGIFHILYPGAARRWIMEGWLNTDFKIRICSLLLVIAGLVIICLGIVLRN